jgi:hypothetical protein
MAALPRFCSGRSSDRLLWRSLVPTILMVTFPMKLGSSPRWFTLSLEGPAPTPSFLVCSHSQKPHILSPVCVCHSCEKTRGYTSQSVVFAHRRPLRSDSQAKLAPKSPYGQELSLSRRQRNHAVSREGPAAWTLRSPLANSFRICTCSISRICIKTNDFNPIRIRTYEIPRLAQKTNDFKSTRINTCAISQCKLFRICTYKKGGGGYLHPSKGQRLLTIYPLLTTHLVSSSHCSCRHMVQELGSGRKQFHPRRCLSQ